MRVDGTRWKMKIICFGLQPPRSSRASSVCFINLYVIFSVPRNVKTGKILVYIFRPQLMEFSFTMYFLSACRILTTLLSRWPIRKSNIFVLFADEPLQTQNESRKRVLLSPVTNRTNVRECQFCIFFKRASSNECDNFWVFWVRGTKLSQAKGLNFGVRSIGETNFFP